MSKLIVVGTGIKTLAHLTQETIAIITHSEKVLYLVNEPLMKEWITRESKICESLEDIYFAYEKRIDAYEAITQYIISENEKYSSLCVVFYGHPSSYASSALWAVQRIKEKGGLATIIPAISAIDCLYADLTIDPGDHGCFSVDATDLLIYQKKFDIRSHLIIWQVANLGTFYQDKSACISILQKYLLQSYASHHGVYLYEAPKLPSIPPQIESFPLSELHEKTINNLSTLYVPPITNLNYDSTMLKALGMNESNFYLS